MALENRYLIRFIKVVAFCALIFFLTGLAQYRNAKLLLNYYKTPKPQTKPKHPEETIDKPWTPMDNYNLQLFSAYFDTRQANKPCVRVVLFKNHGVTHSAQCILKLKDGSTLKITGTFDMINRVSPYCKGGCAWRYESYFFVCPVDPKTGQQVRKVALLIRNETSGYLTVRTASKSSNKTNFVSVCTPALFRFEDWLRIVVFVEFYRAIGVDKLVFYNYSLGSDTEAVLKYYQKLEIVSVVPMPRIPHPSPQPPYVIKFEQMGNYGQQVAMTDCILRMSDSSSFLLLVDVDEFLGAKETRENWLKDMLKTKNSPGMGGIQIRSTFWGGKWAQIGSLKQENLEIADFEMFAPFKVGNAYPVGKRTKLIVRPEAVHKMAVHSVWNYFPGYSNAALEPDQALVYHLRNADPASKEVNPFGPIKDLVMKNVRETISKLQN